MKAGVFLIENYVGKVKRIVLAIEEVAMSGGAPPGRPSCPESIIVP